MGAFEDNAYYGTSPSYICYKCNYLFNIQNIESFMRGEIVTRLDFRSAGLLMHAKATPSCEFLKYLDKDKITSIHGQFRYHWINQFSNISLNDYVIFLFSQCKKCSYFDRFS